MDVNLPPDLDRWLNSRADQIGVEPELLLHQLVDSYRTSGSDEEVPDSGGDTFSAGQSSDRFSVDRSRQLDTAILESLLEQKLDEWIDEDLDAAIEERVADTVESELDARVESAVREAVDTRIESTVAAETDALDDRLDALETDHREAIEDIRDRVIQVKKAADAKTPTEAHAETRREVEELRSDLEDLDGQLASLLDDLSALEAEVDRLDDHAAELETLSANADETDERLNTLAWNVNKIRDHVQTTRDLAPILAKAAQLDIDRAKCEQCDSGVEIGLLTQPECPHCSAELTGVVDSRSFFGKPRLLVSEDGE